MTFWNFIFSAFFTKILKYLIEVLIRKVSFYPSGDALLTL